MFRIYVQSTDVGAVVVRRGRAYKDSNKTLSMADKIQNAVLIEVRQFKNGVERLVKSLYRGAP